MGTWLLPTMAYVIDERIMIRLDNRSCFDVFLKCIEQDVQ